MGDKIKFTVWGSRGSFVQTDIEKRKYGLETTCYSIELDDEIYIIDCGSGIGHFDNYLYKNNLAHKKIRIFITHYHHDHICGLPFTKFIFDPGVDVEIYGGNVDGMLCSDVLTNYYRPPYFPVDLIDISIGDNKVFNIINRCKLKFGEIEVDALDLNHPGISRGYKFTINNKQICIVTDYEYRNDENKESVKGFIDGCDILLIDSYYTNDDYKENWGHSTVEENISIIKECNVKKGYLAHHNIDYTDDYMEKLEEYIKKENDNICFARDNMILEI